MSGFTLASVAIFGLIGALLGVAYFTALEWNVRLYTGGSAKRALLLHLMRIVGVAVIFFLCARAGAVPLLSCLAAFVVARTFVLKRNGIALEGHP